MSTAPDTLPLAVDFPASAQSSGSVFTPEDHAYIGRMLADSYEHAIAKREQCDGCKIDHKLGRRIPAMIHQGRYRCFDCELLFCRECAASHFGRVGDTAFLESQKMDEHSKVEPYERVKPDEPIRQQNNPILPQEGR